MKEKGLQLKDLIVAGAFAALYIVVLMVLVAALGIVPITYIMAPFIVGIICGTIYMLYVMKIRKPGAIVILSVLLGLLLGSSNVWYAIIWSIFCGCVAEVIAWSGKYQSLNRYVLSYGAFAASTVGPFWLLVVAKSSFISMCQEYYGSSYAQTLDKLTPSWIILALIGSAICGGIIGGMLGKRLLRKHFLKAGIA